jgi:predicted secreted protein
MKKTRMGTPKVGSETAAMGVPFMAGIIRLPLSFSAQEVTSLREDFSHRYKFLSWKKIFTNELPWALVGSLSRTLTADIAVLGIGAEASPDCDELEGRGEEGDGLLQEFFLLAHPM